MLAASKAGCAFNGPGRLCPVVAAHGTDPYPSPGPVCCCAPQLQRLKRRQAAEKKKKEAEEKEEEEEEEEEEKEEEIKVRHIM